MKTQKTNLMKLAGIASLLTLTVVMTSCGFNSDPRSKFDVPSVPKHDQPVDVKKVYKDAALFVLTVPSGNMNFVEGKTASFTIKASTPYENASYRLTSSNLPDGAVLSPVSGEKGTFKLTWTPAVGTLPAGKTSEPYTFSINVEVDSKSTSADSARLREIVGADYETMTVTLNKTSEEPTVEAFELAVASVEAGQPVAVTVVANAPGVPADGTLTLTVVDSQTKSNEFTIVSAKDAVTFQAPVREGDKFTYSGIIETKLLKIPVSKKKNPDPVEARLSIKLTNTSFDRSSLVQTKALKITPAPVPTPEPTPEPTATPVPEVKPKVEPAKKAVSKKTVAKKTVKKTTKPATTKPATKPQATTKKTETK